MRKCTLCCSKCERNEFLICRFFLCPFQSTSYELARYFYTNNFAQDDQIGNKIELGGPRNHLIYFLRKTIKEPFELVFIRRECRNTKRKNPFDAICIAFTFHHCLKVPHEKCAIRNSQCTRLAYGQNMFAHENSDSR